MRWWNHWLRAEFGWCLSDIQAVWIMTARTRLLPALVATPEENDILKRLSRRRRRLVEERGHVISAMQSDLQAAAPGLLQITETSRDPFPNVRTWIEKML